MRKLGLVLPLVLACARAAYAGVACTTSSQCPVNLPICYQSFCTECNLTPSGETLCASNYPARPHCETALASTLLGRCVQCRSGQSDCAAGSACNSSDVCVASPQDMTVAQDMMVAPQDLTTAPQHLATAPQDLMTAPQDLMTAPQDLAARPADLSAPPPDLSRAPRDLTVQGADDFGAAPDLSANAGRPSTRTRSPPSRCRPAITLSSVVLPLPLAPTSRQRSPAAI